MLNYSRRSWRRLPAEIASAIERTAKLTNVRDMRIDLRSTGQLFVPLGNEIPVDDVDNRRQVIGPPHPLPKTPAAAARSWPSNLSWPPNVFAMASAKALPGFPLFDAGQSVC